MTDQGESNQSVGHGLTEAITFYWNNLINVCHQYHQKSVTKQENFFESYGRFVAR